MWAVKYTAVSSSKALQVRDRPETDTCALKHRILFTVWMGAHDHLTESSRSRMFVGY